MKIKRFFAADIRQAMRMVKDELGADAVIMSNKSVDGGVEIYAARDFDEQLLKNTLHADADASRNALKPTQTVPVFQSVAADKAPTHIVSSPRKQGASNEQIIRAPRREIDNYLGYAEKALINSSESLIKPAVKKAAAAPIRAVDFSDVKYTVPYVQQDNTQASLKSKTETLQNSAAGEDLLAEMRNEFKQLKYSMAARLSEVSFASTLHTNPVRLDVLHRLADMEISKKLSLKIANRLGSYKTADSAFEKA
ncbi:MAG: flagellar biosynthesis protein FlhF, partial [Methylococcaceae bacterium]|nr:flagellar biosynthesis protein FlhF [Methylococcaceae bacterium]